jgi:hypothetical protein
MNKVIILLVALWAFIAIANARPIMFFADQTDAPLGLSLGYNGIAYAWTTYKKGQSNYRIRFFGTNHINESLTDAWINFANGTIIEHLAVNIDQNYRYFLGDLRTNFSIFNHLLREEIYVTVASEGHSNGTITGYFRCRPHSGIAIVDANQVVEGSASFASGIAWASIDISTIHSLPTDILDQVASIEANSLFNGRVLHNDTNVTSITFNAPANFSVSAPALATATLSGVYNDGKFTDVTVDPDFYSIDTYESYYEVNSATASNNIRGNIYPVLTPSRRRVPFEADTVSGTTIYPGAGFGTLRWANQEGSEANANSYMTLRSEDIGGTFVYVGVFKFHAATNKKNFELVRALTTEINARIQGTGTWVIEFFDATEGQFIPLCTLSDTTFGGWTAAYQDNWDFAVSDYSSTRHQLNVRVSVSSSVQSTLYLDLFAVRSWVPGSGSNQALKSVVQFLNTYPGEFANGTQINTGTDL